MTKSSLGSAASFPSSETRKAEGLTRSTLAGTPWTFSSAMRFWSRTSTSARKSPTGSWPCTPSVASGSRSVTSPES